MLFKRKTKTCQDIVMCRRMVYAMQTTMLEMKKDIAYIPTEGDIDDLEHLKTLVDELGRLVDYAVRYAAERMEWDGPEA